MNILFTIGAILFAVLFLGSGFAHFKAVDAMTGYAQYKGLPAAKAGVLVSGFLFIVGALAIIGGALSASFADYGTYGALAIALVMFPTAVIFHNFWKETDPQAKQNEQIQFNKDIALAGAALVIAAAFNANILG
ncbi:MAG: hypothetical protein RLZZ330_417 [Actinomycetota bacterium]|jgi:uncharacterized membrane protein YphA (DoxX/SURF4 family)